ncbi:hypothetical protein BDF20DRAFT_851720 [Mycotypha africana]|uniref:uncharacterized protein n=1 Tax=Mycotypha africana TaxID=64632 RepID=UPI00230156E0|nr:uncharacterized protein BDF20DRAFT_851720 [Mycotypha africana]KAI8987694.1 hypothetical protein BDF20DRAFT_851720 [Mycotypha africana]
MNSTCEYLSQDLNRLKKFGTILLHHILSPKVDFDIVTKLKFIDTYFVPSTTESEQRNTQTKRLKQQQAMKQAFTDDNNKTDDDHFPTRFLHVIFSFCLKIRDSGQDLSNIEVYQLLYSVLDQCAPFIPLNAWRTELESLSMERERKILADCDNKIDEYISSPALYPQGLHIKEYCKEFGYNKNIEKILSVKIALYNILYEEELSPISLQNHFAFSEAWVSFLQTIRTSLSTKMFTLHAESIENDLFSFPAKAEKELHMIPFRKDVTNMFCFNFENQQTLETTFKECIQSLKYAHTKYITTLVYALYQLILYAFKGDMHATAQKDPLRFDLLRISQSTVWFELYEDVLKQIVFESKPYKESPYIQKLIKLAACYLQFRFMLKTDNICQQQEDDRILLKAVWDHYYLQRSVFLKSIKDEQLQLEKQTELRWVEKIVFTSACSPV